VHVVDFAGLPVFKGATVRTIILLTIHKTNVSRPILYSPPMSKEKFISIEAGTLSIENSINDATYEVSINDNLQPDWSFSERSVNNLLNHLRKEFQPLKVYCGGQIFRGIVSGLTEAFVISEQQRLAIVQTNPKAHEVIKPFLNGRDVRRYILESKDIYLIYTYHGIKINDYPAIEQHLKPFKYKLVNRATSQEWFELQQPQYAYKSYLDSPKIIFPDIATTPRFALDENGFYGSNTIYFIPRRDLYLLGLLNSNLAYFYFRSVCAGLEGKNDIYLRFFGQYLEGFPVAVNPISPSGSHKITSLVEHILNLQQQLTCANTPNEKILLQRQIDTTDHQIDALVYELYGLTDEEIKIVEGRG
jgi:hypothetical protein